MRLARGIMTLLRAAEQSEMNKSLPRYARVHDVQWYSYTTLWSLRPTKWEGGFNRWRCTPTPICLSVCRRSRICKACMNENCETTDQREHLGQYIAGEYVFTFFSKSKNATFYVFLK